MKGLLIVAGVAAAAAGPTVAQPRECRVVHARYEVYANHDRLWVVGSRHLLDVAIDALDKQLEARGWESTVVFGDFTICAKRMTDARELTVHDRVDVAGYTKLQYRSGR